jgi:hypothetical protein
MAGGVAATVGGDLAELFNSDFERGMAEFIRRRRSDAPAFIRQIAEYFVQFEPGRANLYFDVVQTLLGSERRFTIATLNYDLLFERAVTIAGHRLAYHTPPVPRGNLPFLKLHGSCNFLPDPGGLIISDVSFDLPGAEDVNFEGNVIVAQPEQVRRFCRTETSLAPVMSLYAIGKQVLYCPAFVKQQQQAWADIVREATRVYIVGVRVTLTDEHIWNPILHSRAQVFYVDPSVAGFNILRSKRRSCSHLAPDFESFPPILRRHLGVR